MSSASTAGSGEAASSVDSGKLYTRNATGLVRDLSLIDQLTFSMSGSTPMVSGLFITIFVLAAFPRTNLVAAIAISGVWSLAVWFMFSLLTATMPKVGGDYVYNSRILHPSLGFAGNMCSIATMPLTAGLVVTWMASLGLSPTFAAIGLVTGSNTLTNWGNYFAPNHKSVVFVTAVIVLVIVCVLALFGTKILVRTMTLMLLVFAGAWIVDLFFLLFTSKGSYVSTFNHYAGTGHYEKVVAAGAGKGLYPSETGYSTSSTIGTMFQAIGITIWCFYGTYLAAETKKATQRKQMLRSFVGAGVLQTLSLIVFLVVFYKTVGQNFTISSVAGNLGLNANISLSTVPFLASIGMHNEVLICIVAVLLLLWIVPLANCFLVFLQRGLFVYSFEGLLPRSVGKVESRTHAPAMAIVISGLLSIPFAAWAAYGSSYVTVLALAGLFPVFTIFFTGISAIIFKRRRPDLYDGSPADYRPGGIPLLEIAGVFSCGLAVFTYVVLLKYHAQYGNTHPVWTAVTPFLIIGASIVWWYVARAVRRREGINLDLIYSTIPPD